MPRTTPRTPQAAATPPTRILSHRKAAVNSQRRTRAILASSTARTGSRTAKPITKRRALGKQKHKQRHTKNTAADSVTAARPSTRPHRPRRTQQPEYPASDETTTAPLPPRRAKVESARRTNAIYVPSGRQRPLPKTGKPPEPTQARKRRPLRATRRRGLARRLPPAAFPSQSLKSKPAPLSTRQRKAPTKLPPTYPFHLFGPLVVRVLRQKCFLKRITRPASATSSAHRTVGTVPTSIPSGRVSTNADDDDSHNTECHGLCIRQVLVQQFRADSLPSFRSDAIRELGWIVSPSSNSAPQPPGSEYPPTICDLPSEPPSTTSPPSPNYDFDLLRNIRRLFSRLTRGTLHVPTTWEVRLNSLLSSFLFFSDILNRILGRSNQEMRLIRPQIRSLRLRGCYCFRKVYLRPLK